MAKLNKLAKLIANARTNTIADAFIEDLTWSIEQDSKKSSYTPTKSFKPSSMGGCSRNIYYQLIGAQVDGDAKEYQIAGIGESGTDRHERLQCQIMNMKKNGIDCHWVDVWRYIKERGIKDPTVLKKQGNETKLYSEKYNMRFLCDGIIKYENEYYIVEIKTESTFKYNNHDEPYDEHKIQATCYSMTLGIDKVIFIYEDRDNCKKKAYMVTVTPAMKEYVCKKISRINKHVIDGVIPYRCDDTTKCQYCQYRKQCIRDGE